MYPSRSIEYDAGNRVTRVYDEYGDYYPPVEEKFWYGPDGERLVRRFTSNNASGSGPEAWVEYLDDGRYQRVYPDQGPQFVVKVMPTPNVLYRYIQPSGSGQAWTDPKFLLRDHLGSVDVVATWNGAHRDFEYDPFGTRRSADWSRDASSQEIEGAISDLDQFTQNGYTGHEHLDSLKLIHMKGRVYDPVLGRFLQSDPVVSRPHFSQDYNRYAYAFNSPLSVVDPTGYVEEEEVEVMIVTARSAGWGGILPVPDGAPYGPYGDGAQMPSEVFLQNIATDFDERVRVVATREHMSARFLTALNGVGVSFPQGAAGGHVIFTAPSVAGASGSFLGSAAITEQREVVWVFRAMVVGRGRAISVLTEKGQRVRVMADDSVASAHFQSFTYEFTVTPYPETGSMSASPVYEIDVTTGAFNQSPLNTDLVFPGDGVHDQSRWSFRIQPTNNGNCQNCGNPTLTIFTEEIVP